MKAWFSSLVARYRAYPGLWATADVGRVFMVCYSCRRVVPAWRLIISKPRPNQRRGCVCGSGDVKSETIPEWRAGYWLLVRGFLIRRLIGRNAEWDPRLPLRAD